MLESTKLRNVASDLVGHPRPRILAFALLGLLMCNIKTCQAADSIKAVTLEAGYREMYGLDFEGAHQNFATWEQIHPEDPMGPVSNAAAYLFSEFQRMHILESELFVDDGAFKNRPKLTPDSTIYSAFNSELEKAQALAEQALARSPDDHSALFAKIMIGGLRSDYQALIEKRNFAALSTIKNSRSLAETLVTEDPSYYDAYLAIGVENYLLSLNSAPVRWFLRLGGAQTNKQEGLSKLRLTAEKGHYLAPYARLLLAVAALRDHNRSLARSLLTGLAQEFPSNQLYKNELARITP